MTKTPANFKQADVTRALKGALAAGVEVEGVRITPLGEIHVSFARGSANQADAITRALSDD